MRMEKEGKSTTKVTVKVRVTHDSIGTVELLTRELSDEGVFILCEDVEMPPLGSIVDVQVLGMAEDAPVVPMEVILYDKEGMALRFVSE